MLVINLINQTMDPLSKWKRPIKKTLKTAYQYLKMPQKAIINIILVTEEEIHTLNRTYRGIDRATDVLSFENTDSLDELGDVFISLPHVKAQAQALNHSELREIAFLALHGFLHCLGYDHEEPKDEQVMIALQQAILSLTPYQR
ncbi:MAG: rRNA maturation RNase YbeY [Candidatus Izemoplasmatales bacterium]|nr:rRNA maturation RNase YbeY [Candidatus Izemoplasmatales bacterium]